MVYTLWENTPLKWHKFLTFFLLPLGTVLNVCQAILVISDIQNWTGILIPVNIIDLIRLIACAILGITAIYGCLPSRRRWYGPKCAIILYAVLSVYSYVSDQGEKYHAKGCRYLRDGYSSLRLEEAVDKGYTPCSVCNPPRP